MKYRADQFARVVHLLDAASYNAGAEAFSASADCQGYREGLLIINLGVITATGDVSIQCEDSPDNTTWTDITGAAVADTVIVVANDQSTRVARINLESIQRYFRVGYDVDDDAAIMSMDLVLLHPKYGPASQQNALLFNIA